MSVQVEDDWEGWDGDTIVQLSDGTVWRQEEYHYEYSYAHRPQVSLVSGLMPVQGMSRAIRVRRLD
jgi:hypothetical protein